MGESREQSTAKLVGAWSLIAAIATSLFAGYERLSESLWGEELREQARIGVEHAAQARPVIEEQIPKLLKDVQRSLASSDSLRAEVHRNEHANRRWRVEQSLVACQQRERQAARDSLPFARDCVAEYRAARDSLDDLR